MKKLSLTEFADVIGKTGESKMNRVAEIKNKPSYHPARDYYKQLREAINELHSNGSNKKILDDLLKTLSDAKKKTNYTGAINGYKKWVGNKSIELLNGSAPSHQHSFEGVTLSLTPYLHLKIKDTQYIIKLYFNKEPLKKARANVISGVMELTMREHHGGDCIIGVLDVPKSKLHTYDGNLDFFKSMMKGELLYIRQVWDAV